MNYSISAEEGNVATSLESFLSGTNAPYIAELYARFLENPKLVDKTWEIFFTDLSDDLEAVLNEMGGASWAASVEHIIGYNGNIIAEELSTSLEQKNVGERDQGSYKVDIGLPTMANGLDGRMAADKIRQATQDSISALMMVRVYRVRGHSAFVEANSQEPVFIEVDGEDAGELPAKFEILPRCFPVLV